MQRKFLTNLILMILVNFLIKPLYIFGIDMGVQNRLGTEEFGLYVVILNCTFLFNILLDLGITNFNTRNISQNQQLLNKHFSTLLPLKLVLSILYFVFTFIFAYLTLNNFTLRHFSLLMILMLNQFLLSFILYLRSNITSMMMFKTESMMSVLDKLLMIIIIGILLYSRYFRDKFTLEWFIYGQTAAYILTALIGFIIVALKSGFTKIIWNSKFFYTILRQSLPFALLAILMSVYNRIDAVMLESILGGTEGILEAGIYQQSFRLLDAATMVALLFTTLLLPIFSRGIKLKENLLPIIKSSFTILYVIGFIAITVSWLYGKEIISSLYPQHIQEINTQFLYRVNEGAYILGILFIGFIGIISTYIFGTLLTANNSLKQLNTIAFAGIIIYITLNIILIPNFKAIGAALSSMITQVFTAVMQIILSFKVFRFKLKRTYLIKLITYSASSLLIAIILKYINFGGIEITNYRFSFLIPIIIISTISIIIATALNLFNLKSVIQLVKSSKKESDSED